MPDQDEKLKRLEKLERDRQKEREERIRQQREAEKRRLSYTKIGVKDE